MARIVAAPGKPVPDVGLIVWGGPDPDQLVLRSLVLQSGTGEAAVRTGRKAAYAKKKAAQAIVTAARVAVQKAEAKALRAAKREAAAAS